MTTIVPIVLGAAVFLNAKRFANEIIDHQNRVWGFRFGDRTRRITFLNVRLMGLIGIVIGVVNWVA